MVNSWLASTSIMCVLVPHMWICQQITTVYLCTLQCVFSKTGWIRSRTIQTLSVSQEGIAMADPERSKFLLEFYGPAITTIIEVLHYHTRALYPYMWMYVYMCMRCTLCVVHSSECIYIDSVYVYVQMTLWSFVEFDNARCADISLLLDLHVRACTPCLLLAWDLLHLHIGCISFPATYVTVLHAHTHLSIPQLHHTGFSPA